MKGAQLAAARLLHQAVRAARITYEGRELRGTATVGIVAWVPEHAGEAAELLEGAGRALDRRKDLRGNRAGN